MLQRLDGADGRAQHLCHLTVAITLQVLQDQHCPLVGRQLAQCSPCSIPQERLLHLSLHVPSGKGSSLVQAIVVAVDLAPRVVNDHIVGDPIEPCPEMPFRSASLG